MMLPLGCLAVIVWAMTSGIRAEWKFAVVLAAATIGTHSFGHGLSLWPVAICLGMALPDFGPHRWKFVGASLVVGAATLFFYFTLDFRVPDESMHSYGRSAGEETPGMKNLFEPGKDLDDVARFTFVGIGNVMARVFHTDPVIAVTICGRVIALIFALFSILLLVRWRNRELRARLLPWLAVGGYSFAAAIMLALGRSDLNRDRALLSRYMSPTMFVAVGVLGVAAVLLHRWRFQRDSRWTGEVRSHCVLGLAIVAAMLMMPQWVYGIHKMDAWKSSRLQARVALIYLNHHEPQWSGRIDKNIEFVRSQAAYLNSRGLLDPPLFEKFDFGTFEKKDSRDGGKLDFALSRTRAAITGAAVPDGEEFELSGYALLGGSHGRIADGVLLTWRSDEDEDWKVCALAEMEAINVARASVVDTQFQHSLSLAKPVSYAKWSGRVALADLPEGRLEFRAWALDADKMKAHLFFDRVWLPSDRGSDRHIVIEGVNGKRQPNSKVPEEPMMVVSD